MAYTKNTWADGDVVTSEKLNHMEDGIADSLSAMFINEDANGVLDKTWQEIYDAMAQGKLPIVNRPPAGNVGITHEIVYATYKDYDGSRDIYVVDIAPVKLIASSATEYPVVEGA